MGDAPPAATRTAALVAIVMLSSLTTACKSPFGAPDDTTGRVGVGVHAWPGYESTPHGDGWRRDVLWPALSVVSTPGAGRNSTDVLWPIVHTSRDGIRRETAVRPLFDLERHVQEDGTETAFDLTALLGLARWLDMDGDISGASSIPAATQRRLLPFFSYRDRGDAGHLFVLPFYGEDHDGTFSRTWTLPPLFASSQDTGRSMRGFDLLWPLFHHDTDARGGRTLIAPLYWHEREDDKYADVLFPFVWSMGDDSESFFGLLPFYARRTTDEGFELTSLGGPLFIHAEDGEETSTDLLWPIFNTTQSPDEWSWRVFPFLWRGESADHTQTHVWPLFGWEERGDRKSWSVAAPLVEYAWDDESWKFSAPWPFVSLRGTPTTGSVLAWPLFEAVAHPKSHNGSVLLQVLRWSADEEADERDFRVLWRLVESTRRAGKDTFAVNPLFRHETNDAGDLHWSILFGLLDRTREGEDTDWGFLWFL